MPQRYISIYTIQLSLKIDSKVSSMCTWELCKLEIQETKSSQKLYLKMILEFCKPFFSSDIISNHCKEVINVAQALSYSLK